MPGGSPQHTGRPFVAAFRGLDRCPRPQASGPVAGVALESNHECRNIRPARAGRRHERRDLRATGACTRTGFCCYADHLHSPGRIPRLGCPHHGGARNRSLSRDSVVADRGGRADAGVRRVRLDAGSSTARQVLAVESCLSAGAGRPAMGPALAGAAAAGESRSGARHRGPDGADDLSRGVPAGGRGIGADPADHLGGAAFVHGRLRAADLRSRGFAHHAVQRCPDRDRLLDVRRPHDGGAACFGAADRRPLPVFRSHPRRQGTARYRDQPQRGAVDGYLAGARGSPDLLLCGIDRHPVRSAGRTADHDLL